MAPLSVTVRVPAKINLHLGVGPLRADGFHELRTVFHAVSLYDEVTIAATDDGELTVTAVGENADGVPLDEDNLAVRAVRAVAELADVIPSATVTLRKGIPVSGGLAGGSADAAAALLAADELWSAGLSRAALGSLAADLGSDVAFLLSGGTALGTGRGEHVSPVLTSGDYHWVLAVAESGLSTPAVYAELDRQRGPDGVDEASPAEGVLAALRAGDVVALGRSLRNDLQPAALQLRPQLSRVLDVGRELGAAGGIVSGSGPTVALLARTRGDAVRIASSLAGYDVCRSVRRVTGPVPGARVITDRPVN
ncbi:MAG TPA: 4-(cytidine 5'-diphospho)-2-C-methyl-D-erythritol kinase [Mycobacteriales bacterium]|nr:4-(cytidine 5'-diphospho)-2-C-methyl-D-erythritol kinase [Mycobacteriales bacterium]